MSRGDSPALADDLLFVVWDTNHSGRPRLLPAIAGLVLAGGLLGELVLHGRIVIEGERLHVADARPVRKELLDRVLASLKRAPECTAVRIWLDGLAKSSIADVAERLRAAEFLKSEGRTFLLRKERYFHTDFARAMWPMTQVRSILIFGREARQQDLALIALADAAQMNTVVLEDPAERLQADLYRRHLLTTLEPSLAHLTGHVRAATGDAVLTYR
ncbi:GPP34 family phosphoprotein [Nonomuraea sp. NPDC052129]|uniref:GPP34 family phosphoprotein n=1 Tax=Nonomuraea sp. NPDC052129 TaxID=3154651 RepID=UPI0034479B01